MNNLYPIGSTYITTALTCPLATLISGSTWTKVSEGRVLWGSDSNHSAGTTIEAGLPNITGTAYNTTRNAAAPYLPSKTGALYNVSGLGEVGHWTGPANYNSDDSFTLGLDASRSSSIYGNSSTVQPTAFVVNIFQRTA